MSAPCRKTALHGASKNGHTESVKALLEKGADVKAESNYYKCAFSCLLYWMGEGCTCRQGRALFGWWLSVSVPRRRTALHDASSNGHTESVKALLAKGADVNAEDNAKCAFSLWPVLNGRRQHAPATAVRPCRLVVSVSAACRHTALHGASSNGHTESVKALLAKGADVNAEDNYKCAFACLLCWTGDGSTRRRRRCGRFGWW